jgi:hypothetical protein
MREISNVSEEPAASIISGFDTELEAAISSEEYMTSFLRSDLQSNHQVNVMSLTTSVQLKRKSRTNQ